MIHHLQRFDSQGKKASKLFKEIAESVLDSKELRKVDVEHIYGKLPEGQIKTTVNSILQLYESGELPIINNDKLNSILKELASKMTTAIK